MLAYWLTGRSSLGYNFLRIKLCFYIFILEGATYVLYEWLIWVSWVFNAVAGARSCLKTIPDFATYTRFMQTLTGCDIENKSKTILLCNTNLFSLDSDAVIHNIFGWLVVSFKEFYKAKDVILFNISQEKSKFGVTLFHPFIFSLFF